MLVFNIQPVKSQYFVICHDLSRELVMGDKKDDNLKNIFVLNDVISFWTSDFNKPIGPWEMQL